MLQRRQCHIAHFSWADFDQNRFAAPRSLASHLARVLNSVVQSNTPKGIDSYRHIVVAESVGCCLRMDHPCVFRETGEEHDFWKEDAVPCDAKLLTSVSTLIVHVVLLGIHHQ